MKRLIINADDFGMSREVNEGIKKGIKAGMITSVSVMVNMPHFDEAISYLKKNPGVSVGLHFNITEGSPLSTKNKVSTLIREGGNFFYWPVLIFNLLFRKAYVQEIETELTAQYQKLKSQGIQISHIDSHHHIHLYPQIFQVFTRFAQKNKVNALRCRVFNLKRLHLWFRHPPTFKQFIIISLCVIDSIFFTKSKQFYDVNGLYDIAWDKSLDARKFTTLLASLPEGTTEIICHPAVLSKTGNEKFLRPRFKGLSLLLDKQVKQAVKIENIELITRVK